jgi:23S rRNA (cytosine1962-C5)-methyltransferase
MSRDYELLDFGDGRKLERFGAYVLDRPCPTAEGVLRAAPGHWKQASGRFHRAADGTMQWTPTPRDVRKMDTWHFRQREPFRLDLALAPLPSGQVGMFPEQADNWAWIHEQVCAAGQPLRVLNLFAYTGASTIAAAAGGAEVTHVDAAESAVGRARGNAESSGLTDAPIRWIVDDAVKFSRREVRRGRRYDAVILDPPTYGHGKKGEVWQIKRDLPALLAVSAELTGSRPAFVLLTCHTAGIEAADLEGYLADSGLSGWGERITVQGGEMRLRTADGRELPSGVFVRTSNLQ